MPVHWVMESLWRGREGEEEGGREKWWEGIEEEEGEMERRGRDGKKRERWKEEGEEKRRVGRRVNDGGKG